MDRFFNLKTYLKFYQSYSKDGIRFEMSSSYLQKLIENMILKYQKNF